MAPLNPDIYTLSLHDALPILLNGLYDAKLDHQPVLAIVGQQKRMSLGSEYQQEVDLQTLFKDVSVFVNTCMEPVQARHLIDRDRKSTRLNSSHTVISYAVFCL